MLTIPAAFYMEWIQNDAEALYSRTKVNMRRLITQTTDARRYLFLEAKERLVSVSYTHLLVREDRDGLAAGVPVVLPSA